MANATSEYSMVVEHNKGGGEEWRFGVEKVRLDAVLATAGLIR